MAASSSGGVVGKTIRSRSRLLWASLWTTMKPYSRAAQAVFAALHPGDLERTLAEIESEDRPYGDFDPFEDDLCGGCPVLPVCLGSCPKRVDDGAARCVTREGLERRIVSFATT